jgi:type II secretory pathway predicted ATPase ExeA
MKTGLPNSMEGSPFTNAYSVELYWEGRRLRTALSSALGAVKAGRSVWVKGPPGSGRQSFIKHLLAKLSKLGLPVAVIDTPPPSDAERFIEMLHRWLSDKPLAKSHIERCETLYAELLDGLWRGGAVLGLTEPDQLSSTALDEAAILTQLNVLGVPLVRFVLCGETDAALAEMVTVELPPYTGDELGKILNHRLVMSGNAGVMDTQQIEELATRAGGVSEVLELGQIALGRLLYKGAGDATAAGGVTPQNTDEKQPRNIFSPEDIATVGKLLKDI